MAAQGQDAVQGSLEEWLNGRPSWLRAAAQRLILDRRLPTDAEIEVLATHCIEEAAKCLTAAHAPLAPGAVLGTAVGPALRIDSISDIRGVNALGGQAQLDLSKADITIVYGANGSGKSGYARLVKHICGARAAEAMHSNIFLDKDAVASASVRISSPSITQPPSPPVATDILWKAIDGHVPRLRAVHVFDAATAVQLGQSPNTASHLPRTMRFVGTLIEISDRVSANLRNRADQLVSHMPAMPGELTATAAGRFVLGLKANLSPEAIDAACQFTDVQRLERVALEAALAQGDPATSYAKVVGELDRVTRLGSETAAWAEAFDHVKAAEIVSARQETIAKRGAALAYATTFFEGMPLAGVGEEAWRRMWSAAAQYAQGFAYPGHAHPNTDDGARCVLCQQMLDADAKERMKSFADYVANQLESEATVAERALAALVASLPSAPNVDYWHAHGISIGLAEGDAAQLSYEVTQRLVALKDANEVVGVPIVDWGAWQAALAQRIAQLVAERDALAALIDPAGRQQKESQLNELRAIEWLANHRNQVIAEIDLMKQRIALGAATRLTNTAALTGKSNDIGEAELAQGFCERFNEELKRLGAGSIPVEMTHRREGKGKFTFLIQLRGSKQKVVSRDILSEGEQRVVALAAFLADVTGSDRSLPVIFDDPISSLDQRFEESVAKRLVELAEMRQVIVFTHRLSLMVLIESAAEKRAELALSEVTVNVASIARDGADTGMAASIDVFSMKPKAGFNELKNRIGAAKNFDPDYRRIAIKDACSNFRILVERTVEDHLCSKVVLRYRREIMTVNLLRRLAAIEPADCAIINDLMTKYSAFEHSQSSETPSWLPDPDELLNDINAMLAWIDDFDKRAKAA